MIEASIDLNDNNKNFHRNKKKTNVYTRTPFKSEKKEDLSKQIANFVENKTDVTKF